MTPRQALNQLLTSDDFHTLEARLRRVSAFHILGVETRELTHAALLRWLLDPRASHGMGAEPLRRFILLAAREDPSDETLDAVDLDRLDLTNALVEPEHSIIVPGKAQRRRLDVLVSVPLPGGDEPQPIALIEYKVDAAEGEEQTADYAKWAATQRFQLGHREVLPQQVYLCPVASDDVTPAAPFVTIGYGGYLGWLEGVDTLKKTTQAKFLLDEWRSCLLARNDVVDERQETLVGSLKKECSDALQVLRTAPASALTELQHSLDQHVDVLTQLGVRRSRQSKGSSAAIGLARGALETALTASDWSVTGGSGSVRAVFLPSINEVAAWADAPPRLSGLCIQLFSDRPAGGRFRLVLEVVGDLPGANRDASKAVRLEVAKAVRGALKESDATLPLRQHATLVMFVVEMPKVTGLDSDVAENVAEQQGELEVLAGEVAALETTLRGWCESHLRSLLDESRERLG